MINSQDIKKGTAIRMDGGIWVCIDCTASQVRVTQL